MRCSHPWHIFPSRGLIVVDLDPLELQIGGLALERSGGINAMLVAEQDELKWWKCEILCPTL